MSKSDQVLILEPPTELKFKGPFISVVTSELKLKNPSQKRVLFKVKTTAPKCYCVRPNSGIIEPGGFAVVSVMLQPFDHNTAEKSKHKFMVQSMYGPDGSFDNQDLLWKDAVPSQLMDSKLKCVFEQSPDATQDVNLGLEEVVKPVYTKEVASSLSLPSGKSSADSSKLNKSAVTSEDKTKLNNDCSVLNAEIQRLKAENESLRGEGLRLRKVALSQTVSSTPERTKSFQPAHPDAVAPANTIPAAVYLIAFLILGLLIGKLLL